jgi:hypothetical protein
MRSLEDALGAAIGGRKKNCIGHESYITPYDIIPHLPHEYNTYDFKFKYLDNLL